MDRIIEKIEEGKVKRFFRSRNKLSYPGAAYHVTQRATGKDDLFIEDSDYLYMLHLIKEKSRQFDLNVFSFALMPNHLHGIICVIDKMDACKEICNPPNNNFLN